MKLSFFSGHLNETSCARFAPKGGLIASGDVKGCVKIWSWEHKDLLVKKEFDFLLGGKIRQMHFTEDGQKLVVCGEGSGVYAKAISIDTGSTLGELGGHSKPLLACTLFSAKRPFQIASGGEDQIINFYQGPPFKFKHSNQKSHTNYVTDLKFNPAGDTLVSVSSDKRIVLHDPETGTEKGEVKESPHVGTISSVNFLNENTIYTTSMDKTVRVYDLTKGTLVKKFTVNKKPEIDDMQVAGSPLPNNGLFSLSLSGALNIWKNYTELENDSLPTESFAGHQGAITTVQFSSELNKLVSYDNNGRTIIWQGHNGQFAKGKGHGKQINHSALTHNKKGIFSVSVDGVVKYLNLENDTFEGLVETKANIVGLAASKSPQFVVYAISDNRKQLFVIGQEGSTKFDTSSKDPTATISLDFTPTSIDTANDGKRLFIGGDDGKVRVVVINGKAVDVKVAFTHKTGTKVTSVRVSNYEDKFIATGDNTKSICLFDAAEYNQLTSEWSHHQSMIRDLAFTPNNKYVVSCSLDTHLGLFNTETKQKVQILERAHRFDINKICFVSNESFVTAGADALIKQYNLVKKE